MLDIFMKNIRIMQLFRVMQIQKRVIGKFGDKGLLS